MLDIQFVRDNAEVVALKAKQKGYEVDVKRLLEIDNERRKLGQQVDSLRASRNENASKMKSGKADPKFIEDGKRIKVELTELEKHFEQIDQEFAELLRSIPNLAQDDVPVGDEKASVEVSRYGETATGAEDHLDLMTRKGWVDFERGAKVAGTKFYFIKGDLALLENAITQYALKFVIDKGFSYMLVPNMVNSRIVTGTGFAPRSNKQSDEYFIEDEDLALIATSELPLTGYHADEIIDEADLPLLYAGYSPCYRKEAGTYGKHTRGLFRVHQFNKIEMYVYTLPEQSDEMHEKILKIEEDLWQSLDIAYRVVNIATGDLGAPAAKKYDLEYWSKVDGTYRELTSCSNCTDFQARNLNIRVRRNDGHVEILHTLNGTAVSLARSLIAVVEHYQTPEGNVRIPDVLKPLMSNRTEI